jgi:hypothetical protein
MSEYDGSLVSLGELHGFWEHWGFESWHKPPFAGAFRRQRFVKSGILGRVAEFMAWDCIVWTCGTEAGREALWRDLRPLPDIMTQRFLFLLKPPWPERRIRSFAWGFRGYVEFFAYWPGFKGNTRAKDLTGLVDLGLDLLREREEQAPERPQKRRAASG